MYPGNAVFREKIFFDCCLFFPKCRHDRRIGNFKSNFEDLSNDPDKNCSIFYCSAAIRFPEVETVMFLDEEFIKR